MFHPPFHCRQLIVTIVTGIICRRVSELLTLVATEINYFTKWEYPVETGVGTSFNLTCSPPDDAKPPATVVWTFNGVPKGTDGVYNVESTELSDAGLYMCTAENVAGVLNYTINVTILGVLL